MTNPMVTGFEGHSRKNPDSFIFLYNGKKLIRWKGCRMESDYKLFLVVTVGPDVRLLDRFVRHYKKEGIDEFLIIVHTGNNQKYMDGRYRAVYDILQPHGIEPVVSWSGNFTETEKQQKERLVVETKCRLQDWVVYADLDEFHHHETLPVAELVKIANDEGLDFISGRLLDRVAPDGSLARIDDDSELAELFPCSGFLTRKLLKAWDWKIVAAKATCNVGGGHHILLQKKRNPINRELKPFPYKFTIDRNSDIQIHHFKWDSEFFARIRNILSSRDKSLEAWRKETWRFLKHYKKHGRIDVSDPRFQFRIQTLI